MALAANGNGVIRPIAFRPSGISSPRFGLDGERYRSTPILTKSGSDRQLYSSTNFSYPLRQKLQYACSSLSSPSPPAMAYSFGSLPHKLMICNSLESMDRSTICDSESMLINQSSLHRILDTTNVSEVDLTPSPSDSGVCELEAALRERDSELAYLRQTMEHNEQVIFRVYQEKERKWEKEIRQLKHLYENRLKVNAQRIFKLEQMLMMQSFHLQQKKHRLCSETRHANYECEKLREEIRILQSRLEESEWKLCQKTGEISFLKTHIKDYQNSENMKGHEIVQFRSEFRELQEELEGKRFHIMELQVLSTEKDAEILNLKQEISKLLTLKENNGQQKNVAIDKQQGIRFTLPNSELLLQGKQRKTEMEYQLGDRHKIKCSFCNNTYPDSKELVKIKQQMETKMLDFEKERFIWTQEKHKVLNYQKQLQTNYIHMYKKTTALQQEMESLTEKLDYDTLEIKEIVNKVDIINTIKL